MAARLLESETTLSRSTGAYCFRYFGVTELTILFMAMGTMSSAVVKKQAVWFSNRC